MKHIVALSSLGLVVCFAGCASTNWSWVKKDSPSGKTGELMPASAYVSYLNENAGRMQSVRVEELLTDVTVGFQSFSLRGQMVAQKQRNFRMSAKVAGQQVVDLGSNDQEFWYWISKADPPYQIYCSYKDLNEGRVRKMPFPFQPEWVMEAMGLAQYGPAEKYKIESDAENVKLVEKTTSPQGQAVRKVIVMKRRPMVAPAPQVTDFLLLDDATGKEICAAHIKETQIDRATGALLPRRMELRWPAERMKMALKLDGVNVNIQTFATMFQRERMNGVASFNLAKMAIDNSPPPQVFSSLDSGVKTIQGP